MEAQFEKMQTLYLPLEREGPWLMLFGDEYQLIRFQNRLLAREQSESYTA